MTSRAAFPYALTPAGPTALAEGERALAEMLAQIVLVGMGERVNRPDFGTPLRDMVFENSSAEVNAAYSALIQGAIRQWSQGWFELISLEIKPQDECVNVHVTYADARTRSQHTIVLPAGSRVQ